MGHEEAPTVCGPMLRVYATTLYEEEPTVCGPMLLLYAASVWEAAKRTNATSV